MIYLEKITLSVNEISEVLGVSQTTIYSMVRQNEIPHKKVRGRILFHKATIENWLSNEDEVASTEI